jgi:hypothetical protein
MIADPLDGVTTFLAVAETSSFTAAAGRPGVTPTAVSRTIRLLKARHGVTLFQRTDERLGFFVVMGDVLVDGRDQLGHAGEVASTQPFGRDVAEESLNHIQPRCRGRREVHVESRMLRQAFLRGRMFVRGVVISDQLLGRRRRRSAPRRMKGDRVTVRILCDEEATDAYAEWPGFGKRPHRLSQRQRDRRCLEHDRARWTVSCRFETEYLYVKLSGRCLRAHKIGTRIWMIGNMLSSTPPLAGRCGIFRIGPIYWRARCRNVLRRP